jgi:hypothetical protein
MVSGPVPKSILESQTEADEPSRVPRQSPRSVSEPVPRPKLYDSGLAFSTSRREGLTLETSKSIAGLSDALLKLKMKKAENGSLESKPRQSLVPRTSVPTKDRENVETTAAPPSTSMRLSSIHRPRQSLAAIALGNDNIGGEGSEAGMKSTLVATGGIFKGIVAFVDVKTSDGDDAGPIFTEMLRSLGAKVGMPLHTSLRASLT